MVRGLGEQQKELRQLTTLKICAILAIKHFTYQGLQRESKIQTRTLKYRLEELHAQNIITKRYKIYSSKHDINPKYILAHSNTTIPNSNRYGTLYLLNYSNTEAIDFVKQYYSLYYGVTINKEEVNSELNNSKPMPSKINVMKLTIREAILHMLNTIQWLNYFLSQTKERKVLDQEFKKQSKLMVKLYDEHIKPNYKYCYTPSTILENKKNAKGYLKFEPSKIQF